MQTPNPKTPKRVDLTKDSYMIIDRAPFEVPKSEFKELLAAHPTTYNQVKVFGKIHDIPRFEKLYGNSAYRYSGIVRQPDPNIPALVERCLEYAREKYPPAAQWNGALCNWYIDGSHGIGAHSDAEADLVPGAPIISFSFGGSRIFRVRTRKDFVGTYHAAPDIVTGHGMMIAMCGAMQKEFTHEVPKTKKPTKPRINVTIRAFAPHATVAAIQQEESERETKRAKVVEDEV
jgi:alkylated DNA repair dioxygenase AlkB